MLTFRVNAIPFLLWVFFTNTASAIGLGEIQVQSNLGDPLRAAIQVLDAPNGLEAACFKLRHLGDADFNDDMRAHVSVKRQSGDVVLIITTQQAINEPILQFTVISDCNALRRDYVILLDPPLYQKQQAATAIDDDQPLVNGLIPLNKTTDKSFKKQRTAQPSTGASDQKISRNALIKTKAGNISNNSVLNSTASNPALVHPHNDHMQPAPRLAISSGESSIVHAENSKFALKLDSGLLNISQASPPISSKSEGIELSDDSAALAHRLAHLETQLVALQKRNTELEQVNKAAATMTARPNALITRLNNWWMFISGFLLLMAVAIWAWFKLYKNRPVENDQALWSATEVVLDNEKISIYPVAKARETNHLENMPISFNQQNETGGTEVSEDILDQAEVFVAHGHANFAIQILQDHLLEAPKESPEPWLLLLDLLKRDAMSAEYMAASEVCRQHFNINVAAYAAIAAPENTGGIEYYPHVIAELQEQWGKPSLESYLNDLIYNHRIEPRQGFEASAYRDLLFLLAVIKQKV